MLSKLVSMLVLAVTLALPMLLLHPSDAGAVLTPSICDPDPKYYCSRIEFNRVTGGYTILNYQHRGAIDGGAKQWRRYYVQESTWPERTFLYDVPSTSWNTNVALPSTYSAVSRNATYYRHNVHFGFEFYECIPGQCYSWWGNTDQIMLAS